MGLFKAIRGTPWDGMSRATSAYNLAAMAGGTGGGTTNTEGGTGVAMEKSQADLEGVVVGIDAFQV